MNMCACQSLSERQCELPHDFADHLFLTDDNRSYLTANKPRDGYSLATGSTDRPNVAVFGNHTSAYYYWKLSQREGELAKDAILIHYDTHDDLQNAYRIPPEGEDPYHSTAQMGIASFISTAIYEGDFSEVYWVLPEWARPGSRHYGAFWNDIDPRLRQELPYSVFAGKERDITVYVGTHLVGGRSEIYFSPAHPSERTGSKVGPVANLRRVVVHKIYQDELPDFSKERRPVVVDIDLDWFSNTGFNTDNLAEDRPSLQEAQKRAIRLAATLKGRGVHPDSVTIATSPEHAYAVDVDDSARDVVSALVGEGVVADPQIIHRMNGMAVDQLYYADAAYQFVLENYSQDPRLKGVCESINTGEVQAFNEQEKFWRLWASNQTYHLNRHLCRDDIHQLPEEMVEVDRRGDHLYTFQDRRGDYSRLIRIADAYGMMGLSRALGDLELLQNGGLVPALRLLAAYERVLEMLQPASSIITPRKPKTGSPCFPDQCGLIAGGLVLLHYLEVEGRLEVTDTVTWRDLDGIEPARYSIFTLKNEDNGDILELIDEGSDGTVDFVTIQPWEKYPLSEGTLELTIMRGEEARGHFQVLYDQIRRGKTKFPPNFLPCEFMEAMMGVMDDL